MPEDPRNGPEQGAVDELERALAGERSGAEAASLAAMAARLRAEARTVPPQSPKNIAACRDEILAAAAQIRSEAPASEALDRAIAGVMSGEPVESTVAPELAGLLAPLLVLVQRMRMDAVTVPEFSLAAVRQRLLTLAAAVRSVQEAPELEPAALEATARLLAAGVVAAPAPHDALLDGRARFVAAAEAARAAQIAPVRRAEKTRGRAPSGWSLPALKWRVLASAAAFVAVVVMGNTLVLSPASASSLPGELLYPVKRFNERIALAIVRDSGAREDLRSEFSERRAVELRALVASDDDEKIIEDWEARFVDARRFEVADNNADVGNFRVLTRGDGGRVVTTTLAWSDRSEIELGDVGDDLTKLPAGSDVRLWVRMRGDDRVPLTLRLKVSSLAEPVATPAITPTNTQSPDTPTPDASPTVAPPTRTVAVAKPTLTPVVEPSPVTTATPPLTGGGRAQPSVDKLSGFLRNDPRQVNWQVRETGSSNAGRLVPVLAARLVEKGLDSDLALGHWVYLSGRWSSDGSGTFVASELLEHKPAACQSGDARGVVARYDANELVLEGGDRYLIDPTAPPTVVGGPIVPGTAVDITFEDCPEDDLRVLLSIRVAGGSGIRLVQGTIAEIGADRLVLTQTNDISDPLPVVFDGATQILPPGANLALGQVVQVRGTLIAGEIHAVEIEILEEPAVSPSATVRPSDGTVQPPIPQPTPTSEGALGALRPRQPETR